VSPFATSYRDARTLFATAAEAAGADLDALRHPLTGPDGEDLAIDLAWLGPRDADRVVFCLSGVHGAEGYAGSGAQVAWLNSTHMSQLPDGVAVLLVHGVNPWGFSQGLRGTEDNIDVNRNWLDHSQPHPPNPLYDEIHSVLCPDDLSPRSIDAMLDAGGRFVQQHGQWALEDAISRGQYSHPDGYHFGGTQLAWSTRQLQSLASDLFSQHRRVAYVDFHSGPVGDGETIFLCFSNDGTPGRTKAASWWGADALAARTVERQWGSRRPTRHGIVFWGLEDLARQSSYDIQVAGAVVEFCSAQPRPDTRSIMRIPMLERWMRFVGGLDCAEAPDYLAEIRDNYAPQRANWENKVTARAIDVMERAVSGVSRWSFGR